MKKILFLLLALCLAMPAAYAELSSKQQKEVAKMAKKRTKELEKLGYVVMGSIPMEQAIRMHLEREVGENLKFKQGISTRTKSKNNGRQMALNAALAEYATETESSLKGKVVTDGCADSLSEEEWETLYSSFITETQRQMRGELTETLSLIRTNPDGTYEIQIWYLIDEQRASDARLKALNTAIAEREMAAEFADRLRKLVVD